LDYAHNKNDTSGRSLNLVHRDVSPQNIIISYDGEIKIIDFGIAKAANKASKTQAGILKGKFGYMSPEQVRGLPLDRRSDVFSTGIVIYELLTGERLFVGESDFSTLEKVRKVEIMPPSTYNRRIPEELENIILKALAKDPDDRYQTAMDFHDDLQSFIYTSGSFFARKDLSAYMHTTFADEIAKESARDEEYRKLNAPGGANSGLEAFDDIGSTKGKPTIPAKAASLSRGAVPPIPRKKSTMLGVGKPVRPPPPPPPRSSVASTAPPVPEASGPTLEMDWDEDELATQIYDKPGFSGLGSLGSLGARSSSVPSPPLGETEDRGSRATGDAARDSAMEGAPSPFDLGPPAEEDAPDTVRPAAPAVPLPEVDLRASSPLALGINAPTPSPCTEARGWLIWVAAVALAIAAVLGVVALFSDAKPGFVNLETRPRNAIVTVDGEMVSGSSGSPFQLVLEAGERHDIEVAADGYDSWTQSVVVGAEETRSLPLVELARRGEEGAGAAAVGTGFSLDTQPSGAQVFVDDEALSERTPITVSNLEAGRHTIRVEHGERYAPWRTQVTVRDGQMLSLQQAVLTLRSVEVAFRSNPAGARITVERGSERRQLGTTPHTEVLDVTGGTWTVRMVRADYRDWSRALEVPTDEAEMTVNANLQPRPEDTPPVTAQAARTPAPTPRQTPTRTPTTPVGMATPPPAASGAPGTLMVNTTPWSMVTVDGRLIGNTPQRSISLRPGRHVVTLVNPDFNIRQVRRVTIRSGETSRLIVTLTPGG